LEPAPTISVIIPTYNRKALLRETLHSLAQQTYPCDRYEVILIDDGSTDGTEEIAAEAFPFTLRYFWQSNQGDAEARNFGARKSQAEFLVFLDDDILVEPGYIAYLIQSHEMSQKKIVVGIWNLWHAEKTSLSRTLNSLFASGADHPQSLPSDFSTETHTTTDLQFRDVYSNNMSLRREAYFKIGMMEGLGFPGSSMWCDLDFTYRAYRQGFEFRRSNKAICWHRDHAIFNLDDYKKRMRTAAYRAVILFQKYPELPAYLSMFYDKTPICWSQDPPRLIARKLARFITSSRLTLWSMEQTADVLERLFPASILLPSLYRYIVGSYIFQGYREGLREFRLAGAQE
jgi:glycosyltransferase involved in cell wall biosynthesis